MLKMFYDSKLLHESTRVIEFYERLGLLPLFENGAILSTNQIYMNPDARTILLERLVENMQKNEFYQNINYEEAYSMVTYDFVNFAPQTDDKLIFNEIMVVPIEDIEFEHQIPLEK